MNFLLEKISTLFFFAGVAAAVGLGAWFCYPEWRSVEALRAERERALMRIGEKKAEIAKIKSWQKRFNSDREFVEDIARKRRRVFPGELVFVFEDEK